MASDDPERLLGVRGGFLRYFHHGLARPLAVAVVGQPLAEAPFGLPLSDRSTLALARDQALELQARLGDAYQFYVGAQPGLESFEVGGQQRYFIRLWSVVLGPVGEAWGASGSLQLPAALVQGLEASGEGAVALGKRKQGGIMSSLTGGLEGRRAAAATATYNALCSLFYGILRSRPSSLRWERDGV
ncbi:MAG TPA: DUF84 family protein [Thermoanaerobaculia bacterium]|nr:DUF84 family protein [Thermoanaerobaculia bacterium]